MAAPRATRTYVERLTPAPWVWLAALPVAASSGLVVLTAFGARVAVPVAVAAVVAAAWALLRTSAVVTVGDGRLVAGRAQIPVGQLGVVRELDATQMSALRGPRADARAYLCQRGWIAAGFTVEVADPDDPVPFWLVSSRRPDRASAALRAEIDRCAADQAHSRQTS